MVTDPHRGLGRCRHGASPSPREGIGAAERGPVPPEGGQQGGLGVRVGADRCEITLKSGRSYDAKHVPWLGTDWLATRLREHGVRFGALTVPELTRDEKRRAVAKGLFAVLVPAAYLYFAYRILMKASRGPHQDESVANQYQRKKQRKRGFAGVAGLRACGGVDDTPAGRPESSAVVRRAGFV